MSRYVSPTFKRRAAALGALAVGMWSTSALAQSTNNAAGAGGDGATNTATDAIKSPLPSWDQVLGEVSSLSFLELTWWRVAIALFAVMMGFLLRTYLLDRLLKPVSVIVGKTESELDDQLLRETRRPAGWLINILGFYVAVLVLRLPAGLSAGVLLILNTVGVVFVAWMLYNGVEVLSLGLDRFTRTTESQMDDHLVPLVRKIMRVAIIVVTLIMIIQQWGYDVTSLIAGLGLGGLAFALAAQQTLANLFGSIMIFTDRPFGIGDWIKTKHGEGVVEEIGLRSTKVRTFTKSLISVPNADIASTSIENFSQMTQRRVKTTITLTYATTPEQMEFVIEGIKDLLERSPGFAPGYSVSFVGLSASSLDVMIYAFTETTVWAEFLEIRQKFFLDVMRLVDRAGTSFAFPSQSLYIEGAVGQWEQPASGAPPMHRVPDEVLEWAAMRDQEVEAKGEDEEGKGEFGSSDGLASEDGEQG